MTNLRANVYSGDAWSDPVLWYAKGVQVMRGKSLSDQTSWRFWAAMHGFNAALWEQVGYLKPAESQPTPTIAKQFWKQCQHGSWYFLPWHRGYLLAFEAIVREAVVSLGGPSDWALPYWNYFARGQADLPPAFASNTWPGQGPNPLFVAQRYGPNNDGHVWIPTTQVNLKAMRDRHFTGVSTGGSPGFGGVDTGFSHGGPTHGGLESQPHDMVHVYVGGTDPGNANNPGLMTDPDSAALDPIFWLHHANIDRLWESWKRTPPGHQDPTNPHWKLGPTAVGQRRFFMPRPSGEAWEFTPAEVSDLASLGYEYDDLSPTGLAPAALVEQPMVEMSPPPAREESAVPVERDPELVGATTGPVTLDQHEVPTHVQLAAAARRELISALPTVGSQRLNTGMHPAGAAPKSDPGSEAEPPFGSPTGVRVLLNLENVRGTSDGTAFHVYVGLPADQDPQSHPELLAGTIAPFGVRKASRPDDEHGGQGLNFVLDITDIVRSLNEVETLDVDQLPVRLIPVGVIAPGGQLSIGRISIYRQDMPGGPR